MLNPYIGIIEDEARWKQWCRDYIELDKQMLLEWLEEYGWRCYLFGWTPKESFEWACGRHTKEHYNIWEFDHPLLEVGPYV